MYLLVCFQIPLMKGKYENYKLWTKTPSNTNAIDGLYSNWITSQLLATARPSTRLIKEHNLIEIFLEHEIKAIINLQQPNEHELCGDGIHKESGFSYLPQDFIDEGIMCYNFGWVL